MKVASTKTAVRPYLTAASVFLLGILLSAVLFTQVRKHSEEEARIKLETFSDQHVSSIQDTVQNSLREVDALLSFYMASREVERHEFRGFVQHLLSHDPAIKALEWIPRVPDSHRKEFVEAIRTTDHPEFQITEIGPDGDIIPAAKREEYFPVTYVEPLEGNEPALGFDLASNADRLHALQEARDSGEKTATVRIHLVQAESEEYGVLIFQPMYRKGASPQTLDDRRRELTGFLLLVFRVSEMLEKSLNHFDHAGVDLHLYDDSAPGGRRLLGRFDPAMGTAVSYEASSEANLLAGPHVESFITVANRRWKVICSPSPDFPDLARSSEAWGVLAASLLCTAFLSSYIFLILVRIETAREHTAQMVLAKEQLEDQNRELKKLDLMKDGLMRDVSHELKTPVAKHAMQLEILKHIAEKHRLSASEEKALDVMEDSIRRQESVIRNLLDLSLLESGGRTYRSDPVRLDELLRRIIDEFRQIAERYGIDTRLELHPLTIRSDGEMLWHLFSNLVSNAIKFRRKGTGARIDISAGIVGEKAVIRFADNGIGLNEDEKLKVFDRFYQSSVSNEGSGIGLAICQMIVEGLGGTIVIESEGRDRGTVVCVTLKADEMSAGTSAHETD